MKNTSIGEDNQSNTKVSVLFMTFFCSSLFYHCLLLCQVSFASFGTPTGAGLYQKGSCDAADSVAVVAAACVGKSSCQINASNDNFGGDPCYGANEKKKIK
jgi:hypothetical protein